MRLDVRGWRGALRSATVDSAGPAARRCGGSRDRSRGPHRDRERARERDGHAEPLVLGIETSCDETGIGIVRGRTLLSNTIASSMDEHARYGGVVPEVAARAHLEALQPSIEAALAESGVTLADLDAVAVTSRTGPRRRAHGRRRRGEGARRVARDARCTPSTTSSATSPPTSSTPMRRRSSTRRSRCSSAAGTPRCSSSATSRPTSSSSARRWTTPPARRSTRSRGCSGCRIPGVPRSTGPRHPEIPTAIPFPRGLSRASDMAKHRYDFSFSGLKTAVARWVEQREAAGEPVPVADVAAILPRGRRRRARDEGARRVRATTACRACCSAAASSPTGACATWRSSERMPRASPSGSRRCRSAPTTAR